MDCSIPGFNVLRHLLEFAQTHVHRVGDAIQSSHLCHPLLLQPSIFLSIKVFSNEPVLHLRWPKYWSVDVSISPYNEYSELISFRIDWLDILQPKGLWRVFSNTTAKKHQSFGVQPSLWSNSHIHAWLLETWHRINTWLLTRRSSCKMFDAGGVRGSRAQRNSSLPPCRTSCLFFSGTHALAMSSL